MTGSLQVKRGYYHMVVQFYDENGKRKTKWRSTGLKEKGNKRKAEQMLSALLESYKGKEKRCTSAEVYFDQYITQWHEGRKPYLEVITWEGYSYHLKHIMNYFRDKKIKMIDLKANDIKEYYEYQLAYGRTVVHKNEDTGLSTRTVKRHRLLIVEALNDAVEREIININPAKGIKVPQKVADKKLDDDDFIDAEEISHFFRIINGSRLESVFKIILYYGLRRSEALGLTWDAVNFDTNQLIIKRTVVKMKTLVAKDRTKNDSSFRTYPLHTEVRTIFLKIKEQQEWNRKLLGRDYNESDYVFTWEDGRPYSPDYLTKSFKKIVVRDDLLSSKLNLHSLRKSCISLLVKKGRSIKDIQKWVGHSENSDVTLKIYAKVKEKDKLSIAQDMAECFQVS